MLMFCLITLRLLFTVSSAEGLQPGFMVPQHLDAQPQAGSWQRRYLRSAAFAEPLMPGADHTLCAAVTRGHNILFNSS